MDLKNKEWGEFYLNDIFSEIQRGKRLKKNDHKKGTIPYVSSTAANNGTDGFIGNKDKVRIFSACLTIANSGSVGATFYQPYTFVASDHVTKLKNQEFNRYVYLFISVVTNRLKNKYSFNREINDKRIQKEKIVLPITPKGDPNYAFMVQFMQQKEQAKKIAYKNYIGERLKKSKDFKEVIPLSEKKWCEFEIGKLFKLSQGKSKGLNHLSKTQTGINYLGATNLNNGVLCQVNKDDKLMHKGNSIAFIRNGEGSMGYSIYKVEDFIATSDISVGYNSKLNRYIGTFITTVADKVRGKYNFGYKRSGKRLLKEKLLLPITENNEPDYDYMDNYMKRLEYEKLNTYLNPK